ncbi:MAG: ABC transporter permease [Candidatus Acidiferrales bacterium]
MAESALVVGVDSPGASRQELVVVRPSRDGVSLGLAELWKHRRLLRLFVWRDVKVRYKQTALGAGWALLQPFLTMLVFTFVFGRLAKVPSNGIAYPVFVFAGLLPWQFFVQSLVRASNTLVQERYLLTKVYVPRLILPVSAVLSGLPDFGVAFFVLLALMIHYRIHATFAIFAVPPLLLLAAATSLCASLFLSTLNVRYRDVGLTIPFFSQLWFFVTPVAYPSSMVPDRWRLLYGINPMAGVMEGFRWAVLGIRTATWPLIFVSAAVIGCLLVLGLFYFERMDKSFADVV